MTTPVSTTLAVEDGGDLIAAIPHLLGFHPAESLVVVTITDRRTPCVGPVIRADLPGPADLAPLAEHLRDVLVEHGVVAAYLVVVGGAPPSGPLPPGPLPPGRAVVEEVADALAAAGVTVSHALWARAAAAGEPWCCYDHTCVGLVADPDSSPAAAILTLAGLVKYPSREALVDTLAADPDAALDRRAALIDAVVDRQINAPCAPDSFAADLALVQAAITDLEAFAAPRPSTTDTEGATPTAARSAAPEAPPGRAGDPDGPPGPVPPLDDVRIAELAVALSHTDVRSECLSLALTDRARAADRLWTHLTRALPAPERAEPACLVAVHAYLRGDGALAGMALDVALAANPGHSLAALLRASVDHAMPPHELRAIIARAARTRAPTTG